MTKQWIKSSYSGPNGGDCIEWVPGDASATGTIPVRDSKSPHGPALVFDTAAWSAFVASVKSGDFVA
ncbi:DUF397 domain-containing protein [Streptomyces sp. HSW2009]|uniref:DUF397 domain-containing protein n=1 Tax=Streptomyces sp. HSW2009 TaxID=3142890 RepID=UPI0032ED213C